jgi:hypothetical protein
VPTVLVDFAWILLGRVVLDATGLVFPRATAAPGLYRFACANEVYVGEAEVLSRRMQHYRTPGVRQPTNLRVNAWMRERLRAGLIIELATATSVRVEIEGASRAADLRRKEERVAAEHAALLAEFSTGRTVVNALGHATTTPR